MTFIFGENCRSSIIKVFVSIADTMSMGNESFDIGTSYWTKVAQQQPVDNLGAIPSNFPKKSVFQGIADKRKQEELRAKDEKTAEILRDGWSASLRAENYPKSNLSKEFFMELVRFAREINTDPFELSAIMKKESHLDSHSTDGKYFGLIQMDEMTFNDTVKVMIEYEQYCKNNPDSNISVRKYEILSAKKGFKKPVCKDMISFDKYKKLPSEKQIKYSEYFLKYHIEKKGIKGQKLEGKQIWALIHSPAYFKNEKELRERQVKLNNVKKHFPEFYLDQLNNVNQINIKS